jgi:hypothetical protein
MAKMFASFAADEVARFHAVQARLGLTPAHLSHTGTLQTKDFGGHLVISTDGKESRIPTIRVPFNSIAELKHLGGIPDEFYTAEGRSDSAIYYPSAPPAPRIASLLATNDVCDLRYLMSDEEHEVLRHAAVAYMMGNSAKVKAFEPMLNLQFGASSLEVVTAQDLVVNANQLVEIKAPDNRALVLNFGSVTVERGGQLRVLCQTQFNTQIMTVLD